MAAVGTRAQTQPGAIPESRWDGGLAARTIVGTAKPANVLLSVIAERIRLAADHLRIPATDLFRIFEHHTVFEGETAPAPNGPGRGFIVVETHHVLGGMVGKGALKMVFPRDLLGEGDPYRDAGAGVVELAPPRGAAGWEHEEEAEEAVKRTMRELMTGESLSMSLKCQATGAPFAGSEGLILCAERCFEPESGRYFLKPALRGEEAQAGHDKELIEFMVNATAEVLTRAGRIAYDRIVHAAETNSTLTARLDLQLPTNVVEGHLRALLQKYPEIIIGDEDMTPRLRQILGDPGYRPTACALARAAADMQLDHAILLASSRLKLRELLAQLPASGTPAATQYRALVDLFFGTGAAQQQEQSLFHHREPLLRALSVALSAQRLDDCGDAEVLALYLRTLLDNQRVMLQALLLNKLPPGQSLPVNWFERAAPLTAAQERQLTALAPAGPLAKAEVADRFLSIMDLLFEASGRSGSASSDPHQDARREFLRLCIRAITSAGDVIPPVERLVFFTLPYTYDCATPKLGVVTRKPAKVCGSALRPQAMAVGALMATEILLRKFTRSANPFAGLKVAIEGLGNAGKNLARLLAEKGTAIVGVSDSKGAVLQPAGFSREELDSLLSHKDAGQRLDTWRDDQAQLPGAGRACFHPDPAVLKTVEADVLVLTAMAGAVDEEVAAQLRVKWVCELTGAAVTGAAKEVLKARHIQVIPDNLASSGGLLVSLSEMLQNSAGQVWERSLEERNLYEQIAKSYDAIIKLAGHYNVDLPTASDMLALRRMHELTLYHRELRRMAAALAGRIRLVRPGEGVLAVVDDDEDGAASGAILRGLFERLNPGACGQLTFLNESFRSEEVANFLKARASGAQPIRHVFVLDRSYPVTALGQRVLSIVVSQCRVTFINNHDLPRELVEPRDPGAAALDEPASARPADLGVLLISPQTLRATVPARHFPTAMILKELAHLIFPAGEGLDQLNWQAAAGSCLDVAELSASPWLLFYAQFNPDKILDAGRALRTVTRAGGLTAAIGALTGVARPDQLETNDAWERFLAAHKHLEERIQVLVEKIILENRRKPAVVHFFTHDETAAPPALAGNGWADLQLYHWISERLIQHGDLAHKPIIVGQVVYDPQGARYLGVRIRSPRGAELMKAGLPSDFESGGLPNTAVARIPLPEGAVPNLAFQELVQQLQKTAALDAAHSPQS